MRYNKFEDEIVIADVEQCGEALEVTIEEMPKNRLMQLVDELEIIGVYESVHVDSACMFTAIGGNAYVLGYSEQVELLKEVASELGYHIVVRGYDTE